MDHTLGALLAPWADLYGGSTVLATGITSLHLAGMLLGGGLALAADRATLRALRQPSGLRAHQAELESVHRLVLAGLGLTLVTGLLMLAADFDALVARPVFWGKMAVLALLAANGWRLARAARAAAGEPRDAAPPVWRRRLGRAARASVVLWFAALLLGAALPVA